VIEQEKNTELLPYHAKKHQERPILLKMHLFFFRARSRFFFYSHPSTSFLLLIPFIGPKTHVITRRKDSQPPSRRRRRVRTTTTAFSSFSPAPLGGGGGG
jgi:hypothetical protein